MNNEDKKREFNRFQIEFLMDVTAKDAKGNEFNEKTVSRDISGGGARFITREADKYFYGQELEMIFYLPGTGDVNARMKAKAKVVRIDPFRDLDTGEGNGEANVAVKFDTLLNFERVYKKKHGEQ